MLQLLKIVNTGKIIALDSDTGEISDVEVVTGFIPGLMAEKKQEAVTKKPRQEKSVIKPKTVANVSEMKKSENGEKRWHPDYDCCVKCGTTERKYESRGICRNCYQNEYNAKKRAEKKAAAGVIYKYKCIDCDREWEYKEPVDISDARCPRNNCSGRLIQI